MKVEVKNTIQQKLAEAAKGIFELCKAEHLSQEGAENYSAWLSKHKLPAGEKDIKRHEPNGAINDLMTEEGRSKEAKKLSRQVEALENKLKAQKGQKTLSDSVIASLEKRLGKMKAKLTNLQHNDANGTTKHSA